VTEWLVHDTKGKFFKYVYADTQKEAALRGYNRYNVTPLRTHDVRPANHVSKPMMGKEEFKVFASKHF